MNKIDQLIEWFTDKSNTLVALSGGVDSALVAYAAFKKLRNQAVAVTADYKTLAIEELKSAKIISSEIGIRHIVINYNELNNLDFVRNDQQRCFYCRSELATHLKSIAKTFQIETIVDGTNIDDLGDYRPGIQAMKTNDIRSPLVETQFSKDDVRKMAQMVGLSVHDRPSNSCLASRIPWGQRITTEKLVRIEVSERIVKQISHARQVRVRDMDGIAKIEFGKDDISLLRDVHITSSIVKQLISFGFSSVLFDSEGYRPGKINVIS